MPQADGLQDAFRIALVPGSFRYCDAAAPRRKNASKAAPTTAGCVLMRFCASGSTKFGFSNTCFPLTGRSNSRSVSYNSAPRSTL